jgi:hypothetical protein
MSDLRYTIEAAADVPGALLDALAGGIAHPDPRWTNDRSRAVVTWHREDAPDGALDDDQLAAVLASDPAAWEPPPLMQERAE